MSTIESRSTNGRPARDGRSSAVEQLEALLQVEQEKLHSAELAVLQSREDVARARSALRALDPGNELVKPQRRRAGNKSSDWKPSERMKALVLEYLEGQERVTMSQVAEGAEISRSAADKVLRYLVNDPECPVEIVDRVGAANIFALVKR